MIALLIVPSANPVFSTAAFSLPRPVIFRRNPDFSPDSSSIILTAGLFATFALIIALIDLLMQTSVKLLKFPNNFRSFIVFILISYINPMRVNVQKGNVAHDLITVIRDHNISDAEIASFIKVSTKTISNWLSGEFKPREEKLQKLRSLAENPALIIGKRERGEDTVEYDMGAAIKKMEAIQEVTLSAVAELLAKANNQSSTVVLSQLQELVNKRLNS